VSELVADRGAPTEATTIAGEGTYLAIIRYRIGGEGSIDLEFVTSATFDELPNGPGNTTDEILSNFGSKAIEGVDVKLPSGP
jgi:hypothetical protein